MFRRQTGRIVTVAATTATAVNTDGRREVLGMATGASETETFWTSVLRPLTRRHHTALVAGATPTAWLPSQHAGFCLDTVRYVHGGAE